MAWRLAEVIMVIYIGTGSTSAQGGRCAVGRGSLKSSVFMCCSHQKGVLNEKCPLG